MNSLKAPRRGYVFPGDMAHSTKQQGAGSPVNIPSANLEPSQASDGSVYQSCTAGAGGGSLPATKSAGSMSDAQARRGVQHLARAKRDADLLTEHYGSGGVLYYMMPSSTPGPG